MKQIDVFKKLLFFLNKHSHEISFNSIIRIDFFQLIISSFSVNILRNYENYTENKLWYIIKSFCKLLKHYFVSLLPITSMCFIEKSRNTYPSKSYDFIFFPLEITHFEVQKPIIDKLIKNRLRVLVIFENRKLDDLIHKSNFNYIRLNSKRVFSFSNYRQNLSILLKQIYFNFNNSFFSSYFIVNSSLIDISSVFLKFLNIYRFISTSYRFQNLFLINDISVVGRTISKLAKIDNKKFFTIMHGTLMPEYKYLKTHADKFYLFGKKNKEQMISYGIDSSKLLVTGDPRLDEKIINKSNAKRLLKKILFEHPSFSNKDILLIATSGAGRSISLAHHKKMIISFFKIAEKYPNILFVIKLHKFKFKDSAENYNKGMINNHNNNVLIVEYDNKFSKNIFDWINLSKLVVTTKSTVGLEASVLNKPVVSYDLMNEINNDEMYNKDTFIYCNNENQLVEIIKKTFYNSENINLIPSKNNVNDWYYKLDARSSQRVVDDLIISL